MSDTSESYLSEATASPNFTEMVTKARENIANDHHLPKIAADTVENIIKGKYRKSIIKRAVHPAIICSTPFALDKVKDNVSFPSISSLSDSSDKQKNQPSTSFKQKQNEIQLSMPEKIHEHEISKNPINISVTDREKLVNSNDMDRSKHELSAEEEKRNDLDDETNNKTYHNKSCISSQIMPLTLKKDISHKSSENHLTIREEEKINKQPKRNAEHFEEKPIVQESNIITHTKMRKELEKFEKYTSISECSSDNICSSPKGTKKKEKIMDNEKMIVLKTKDIEQRGKSRTRSLSRAKKSYIKYAYVTEDSENDCKSIIEVKKQKMVPLKPKRRQKYSSSESDDSTILETTNELKANVDLKKRRPKKTIYYVKENPIVVPKQKIVKQKVQKGRSISRKRNKYLHNDWYSENEEILKRKQSEMKRYPLRERRTRLIEVPLSDSDITERERRIRKYHRDLSKSSNRKYYRSNVRSSSQDATYKERIPTSRRVPIKYYEPNYLDVPEELYRGHKYMRMHSTQRQTHTSKNRRKYSQERYSDSSELGSTDNSHIEVNHISERNERLSRRDSYVLEKKIKNYKDHLRPSHKDYVKKENFMCGARSEPAEPVLNAPHQEQNLRTMVVDIINDHLIKLKSVSSEPLGELKKRGILENINKTCIENNECLITTENHPVRKSGIDDFFRKMNNICEPKPEDLKPLQTEDDYFDKRQKISNARKLARKPFKYVESLHEFVIPSQKIRKKNKIMNRRSLLDTVKLLSKRSEAINVGVQKSITIHKSPHASPAQKHDIKVKNSRISPHHDLTGNLSLPSFVKSKERNERSQKKMQHTTLKFEESGIEKEKKEGSCNEMVPVADQNVVIHQNITILNADLEKKQIESSDCNNKKLCRKIGETALDNEALNDVSDKLINLSPNSNLEPETVPMKRNKIVPCAKLDFRNCMQGLESVHSDNSVIDEYIELGTTLESMSKENKDREEIRNIDVIIENPEVSNVEAVNTKNKEMKKKTTKSLDGTIRRLTRKSNVKLTQDKTDRNVCSSANLPSNDFPKPTKTQNKHKRSSYPKKDLKKSPEEHETRPFTSTVIDENTEVSIVTNEAVSKGKKEKELSPSLDKTKRRCTRKTNENVTEDTVIRDLCNFVGASPIVLIKPIKIPNKYKKSSYTEDIPKKPTQGNESEQYDHIAIDDYNEVSIGLTEAASSGDIVVEKGATTILDRTKNILLRKTSEEDSKDTTHIKGCSAVNSSANTFIKPTKAPKKTKRVPHTKLNSNNTEATEIDNPDNRESSSENTPTTRKSEKDENSIRRSTREKKKLDPHWWAAIIGEPTTKKVRINSTTKQSVKKGSKSKGKDSTSSVSESTTTSTDFLSDVTSSIKNNTKSTMNNTEFIGNNMIIKVNNTELTDTNINVPTHNTDFTTPNSDITNNTELSSSTTNLNKSPTLKQKRKKRTNVYGPPKTKSNKKTASMKSPKKKIKNSEASSDGATAICDGVDSSEIHLQEWKRNEMEISQLGFLSPDIYNIGKNCGYLALPPKHNKEFMNREYLMTIVRQEGINSIKIGEEYLQEAPCCFHIPKGCPAVITNTGDNRLLLFFVLEK